MQHCVMYAVVVFSFEGVGGGGGGGGLEYGLDNMAEKCNHHMSQGKTLLHTNSVFLQSQQCVINVKILNSSVEIII